MADQGQSIFNKKATDKLRNPDDLDKYIRVTNPSVWVVLAACIALLAGLLAWGIFGAVTTNVASIGVAVDNDTPVCFLNAEDVAKVNSGDQAVVGGEGMIVQSVATTPISKAEAGEILKSDYLVSTLVTGDWSYPVYFVKNDGPSNLDPEVPVPVSITVERVAPIALILGGSK